MPYQLRSFHLGDSSGFNGDVNYRPALRKGLLRPLQLNFYPEALEGFPSLVIYACLFKDSFKKPYSDILTMGIGDPYS